MKKSRTIDTYLDKKVLKEIKSRTIDKILDKKVLKDRREKSRTIDTHLDKQVFTVLGNYTDVLLDFSGST